MSQSSDALLLDEGDPRATPRSFRHALGQFATGVAVVTAATDAHRACVTINSFSSLSLDPPLVLWSLRRESGSLAAFRAASHFAVNVLSSDQVEIASRFARSTSPGQDVDGSVPGRGGAPLLAGVAAAFECRRHVEHDGGDHVIFVGEVEHYRCFDRTGLLFAQGRYALAVDHPEAAPASGVEVLGAHPLDDFLIPLLLRAYMSLSAAFDRDREQHGLDLDGSKVLAWLAAHSGGSAAGIARPTLLGIGAAEDAVAALIGRGLVAPRPPGSVAITDAGRRVVAALLARAEALEGERLAAFGADEVATLRRVLKALAQT